MSPPAGSAGPGRGLAPPAPPVLGPGPVVVRDGEPGDYPAVSALTVRAYEATVRLLDGYRAELENVAARAAASRLLVAELELDGQPAVVGSVSAVPDGQGAMAEIARPGEGTLRALAVDPRAQGHGVGEALVRACIALAREAGMRAVCLSTEPGMHSAGRLYRRLGFDRAPERDWLAEPDVPLHVYVLALTAWPYCDRCGREQAGAADTRHEACRRARVLEPPRWCPRCGRRMVVQVVPDGWTASCSEHGAVSGP